MIAVDRSRQAMPGSLKACDRKGKTELDRVVDAYEHHIAAGRSASEFEFKFAVYKADDVKRALESLFSGKCAYCESRYGGVHPVDVEHWRPKGEVIVERADGSTHSEIGYYWLASEWSNLFPSCIHCNRASYQHDEAAGKVLLLGKGNRFPLRDESRRLSDHKADPKCVGQGEEPLLLNPCVDDPQLHLVFCDDAGITPAPGSDKAEPSIRIYGLNRSDLVLERRAILKQIDQRLYSIERLCAILDKPKLQHDMRLNLEDLLSHEIRALLDLALPHNPFSAMARQMISRRRAKLGF